MTTHIGACQRCGKESQYRYASQVRKFCSHACSNAAKWDARPRAKCEEVTCLHCGSAFEVLERSLRSRTARGAPPKYCGKDCEGAARTKPGTIISMACACCSKVVYRRHDLAGEVAFCSRECWSRATINPLSIWGKSSDGAARAAYMREYITQNRERKNELSRTWARNNRPYRNFIQQQRRAAGTITFEQWVGVFHRCNGQCVACGVVDQLQMDHIVPVAAGGKTEPGNLQLLCKPCNTSKGVKPFYQWMLHVHGIEVKEVRS